MTLGSFDAALAAFHADALVEFDDGRFPRLLGSWRGSYCEPTIDPQGGHAPTVSAIRMWLRAALNGRTYDGWKGGAYVFSGRSPINIDPVGEYQYRGVGEVLTGVTARDGKAILVTAKEGV